MSHKTNLKRNITTWEIQDASTVIPLYNHDTHIQWVQRGRLMRGLMSLPL